MIGEKIEHGSIFRKGTDSDVDLQYLLIKVNTTKLWWKIQFQLFPKCTATKLFFQHLLAKVRVTKFWDKIQFQLFTMVYCSNIVYFSNTVQKELIPLCVISFLVYVTFVKYNISKLIANPGILKGYWEHIFFSIYFYLYCLDVLLAETNV